MLFVLFVCVVFCARARLYVLLLAVFASCSAVRLWLIAGGPSGVRLAVGVGVDVGVGTGVGVGACFLFCVRGVDVGVGIGLGVFALVVSVVVCVGGCCNIPLFVGAGAGADSINV